MSLASTVLCLMLSAAAAGPATDAGNRLNYLDAPCDPYYVGLQAPRLVTPQWVGDEGVEAVVVFAIDDLGEPERYEAFLRPILQRLKQIEGRASVSIMSKKADPLNPIVRCWLEDGVSIEAHTYDHPCPCLQKGDFPAAKLTYDRAVDELAALPGGGPVAFRMPCCDSMNSVSPRFFREVFAKTTPQGRFLQLDSSVFVLFTPHDPELPRDMLTDPEGRPRFAKYLPVEREFVNYVENYPYPYVIGRLCWEMPTAVPDDWMGFNLQKEHHVHTVRDMKAAIDAAVRKQGQFTLTFHPGAWIRNDQVIELIDHAVGAYGKRVKFLNFREVLQRLTRNVLGSVPLRSPTGGDNGVRLLDVNRDGFMDVVIGNPRLRQTRLWSPTTHTWQIAKFPVEIVESDGCGGLREAGVRFGVLRPDGAASLIVRNEQAAGVWHFDGQNWVADDQGLAGLEADGPVLTSARGIDQGVRLVDLDADGQCELLVSNPRQNAVFRWSPEGKHAWQRLPFSLPEGVALVDAQGRDAGLRLVDVDGDHHPDLIFSNALRYSLHRFVSMAEGWSKPILAGPRGQPGEIPMIVRADGTNNGAWFNFGHMYLQNEDTGMAIKNHTDARSFSHDFLGKPAEPAAQPGR